MNIGLTVSLNQQNGTLELTLLECGCNVESISIHLHGGASWLYQGYTTKTYALLLSFMKSLLFQVACADSCALRLDSYAMFYSYGISVDAVESY